MEIAIQTASVGQLGIIREIAEKTWPETYAKILTPFQMRYMLDRFYSDQALGQNLRDGHVFLMAWEMDGPLGFASYVIDTPVRGTAKIPKIYVLPAAQGKGVGRKLINEISERAAKAGNSRLTLNVNRLNKARDFYQRLGFSVIAEEDIDLGDGVVQEDFIMEKRLG
jgi:ribosomal protein S18 acetylase RimI-like enzyme